MRELVKNGPSPRQQLQGSNKETDFTWTPAHGLGRRTGPAVVLEAAYQNESVPKLKQEGKAWFEMEGVQVVILIKVQAEHWPPGDKGLIRAAVHQNQGQDYVMTQCGRNSNCTHENMPDYTVRIPWRSFFDGLDDIPPKAEHGAFVLDLFRLQREVNSTFKELRLTKEREAATAEGS